MEALEFLQCYYAMCYHRHSPNGCGDCKAQEIDCELTTDYPEKLVEAVERWAKAHPEEAADTTKPKQDEPCVKTIQDQLEGAIYREIISNKTKIEKLEHDVEERVDHLKKCFDEMNERLTCFINDTVDEVKAIKKHAEHQDKFMQAQCVHVDSAEVESMNEPKRTNKDVLLASFPDARMDDNGIPYACPNRLDAHYNCDKFENCLRCRHTHWLAEVEE